MTQLLSNDNPGAELTSEAAAAPRAAGPGRSSGRLRPEAFKFKLLRFRNDVGKPIDG
jgi:hypothetical protein